MDSFKNVSFIKCGFLFDHVFCNINLITFQSLLDSFIPLVNYYPWLFIIYPGSNSMPSFKNTNSFYNFRKANYPGTINFISYFDWQSTLSYCDVNFATSIWIYTFTILIFNLFLSLPSLIIICLVYFENEAHAAFTSTFNLLGCQLFYQFQNRFKRKYRKCYRKMFLYWYILYIFKCYVIINIFIYYNARFLYTIMTILFFFNFN